MGRSRKFNEPIKPVMVRMPESLEYIILEEIEIEKIKSSKKISKSEAFIRILIKYKNKEKVESN